MNTKPVLLEDNVTSNEAYYPDIYNKGAWIIHTLRYYLGDKIFFDVLRKWVYPTEELERVTDGSQCRFVTTEELIHQTENITGKKLEWLFDTYLKHAKLPELKAVLIEKDYENELRLKWVTEDKSLFEMPVQIKLGNKTETLEMKEGRGKVVFSSAIKPVIDPDNWIAKKEVKIETYSKKGF
jgi:aminopeptidase N